MPPATRSTVASQAPACTTSLSPERAIKGRIRHAVKLMCGGNDLWAPELTERITKTLTSLHPKAAGGWGDPSRHFLSADVSHDDQKGVEWRCKLEDLTWGEADGVWGVQSVLQAAATANPKLNQLWTEDHVSLVGGALLSLQKATFDPITKCAESYGAESKRILKQKLARCIGAEIPEILNTIDDRAFTRSPSCTYLATDQQGHHIFEFGAENGPEHMAPGGKARLAVRIRPRSNGSWEVSSIKLDHAPRLPSRSMIEHKSNCSDLALAYKIDEGVHQSLSEFENMSYPDVTRRVTQQCSEMMPDFSRLLKISPDKPNAVVWNPVSVTSVDGNQEAVAYLQNMDVDPYAKNLTWVSLQVFPGEHGCVTAVKVSALGGDVASR